MAPRRRSRKPGLTRMDAAVDAMLPFGFSDNLVQRKVKELLKEYGGDEGWPFIEADAYKILIDAILDEQEGEAEPDKCSQGENICLDEPLQVERIGDCSVAAEAGPSSLVLPICSNVAGATVQTIETDREHAQPAEGDGERREANALDQGGSLMDEDNDNSTGYDNFESQMQLDNARLQSPPSASCSIPATDNLLTVMRKPLYGWIGSDEEEDFIELTPALRKVSFESAGRVVVNGSRTGSDKQQLKRKSRWDVRPKDT
ncbi:uncharacterized protein LOC127806546 isoform X2 [Diospyros lotus]|uniref:uncharacterized protein LOC127806546 isoform X2 n=1 Tax=Diospyros lotus TaxID=55363 RepID=UPI0022529E65|nr:uncharacterized protein LOC127806546 isoform X2 [Diospyros lotus]